MKMETSGWGVLVGDGLVTPGREKSLARVQIHIEKVYSMRQRLLRLMSLSHLYNMLYFMTFLFIPGALLGEF